MTTTRHDTNGPRHRQAPSTPAPSTSAGRPAPGAAPHTGPGALPLTTARHVAAIDLLRVRAFPDAPVPLRSPPGESGPGYHLALLEESEPLWDADPADVEEAAHASGAGLAALVSVLSLRWGPPEVLDLTVERERAAMGMPVPAPLERLSGLLEEACSWRIEGRWITVGAGRGEGGPPCPEPGPSFHLLAAVGEGTMSRSAPRQGAIAGPGPGTPPAGP
ncbi:hypothetical protein [Streptomyces sp. NPDC003077]|uniref:hypothetical protein n=1 Tax=Streptomyces sp. NPDC003077 TaxID=3154443 RepID=UPI0033B14874